MLPLTVLAGDMCADGIASGIVKVPVTTENIILSLIKRRRIVPFEKIFYVRAKLNNGLIFLNFLLRLFLVYLGILFHFRSNEILISSYTTVKEDFAS